MHYFDILTILCVGLMIGNEFAMSVFVNPVVWQLGGSCTGNGFEPLRRLAGKDNAFLVRIVPAADADRGVSAPP
jgi:hypothetical protein